MTTFKAKAIYTQYMLTILLRARRMHDYIVGLHMFVKFHFEIRSDCRKKNCEN